ncbi:hypothetical protein DRN75_01810 [Nanoarchaeota archaeon]|nr:MAG: hypothetical protein DRN75_01810 [Nanoarchaeota archaeon]
MNIKLQPIVTLLYPALQEFCDIYDYTLPPLNYFKDNITFELKDKINTNKVNSTTRGQYAGNIGLITLATQDRTELQIIKTLLHELGHAIQHYNVGVFWNQVYQHQAKLNTYQDNLFEKQARYASITIHSLPKKEVIKIELKLKEILSIIKEKIKRRVNSIFKTYDKYNAGYIAGYGDSRKEFNIRSARKVIEKLHSNKFSNTRR